MRAMAGTLAPAQFLTIYSGNSKAWCCSQLQLYKIPCQSSQQFFNNLWALEEIFDGILDQPINLFQLLSNVLNGEFEVDWFGRYRNMPFYRWFLLLASYSGRPGERSAKPSIALHQIYIRTDLSYSQIFVKSRWATAPPLAHPEDSDRSWAMGWCSQVLGCEH